MSSSNLPPSFFQMLQSSELPVLVDFWAEWCGPCRMVSPIVQRIAQEFTGRLRVVKVNVDQKPEIAAHYEIQGIPTLIIFKQGKIVWRQSGALPYESLIQVISPLV